MTSEPDQLLRDIRDWGASIAPDVRKNWRRRAKEGLIEVEKLRDEIAEYDVAMACTGYGTGDCDHDTVQDCATDLSKALASEIRTSENLRKIYTRLRAAIDADEQAMEDEHERSLAEG